MHSKVSVIVAGLAAALLTSHTGLAQPAPARTTSKTAPWKDLAAASPGCPQRQFANPADISAMMAALRKNPTPRPRACAVSWCLAGRWMGAHLHPAVRQDGGISRRQDGSMDDDHHL